MNKEQLALVFGGVLASAAALFALVFSLAPSKPYVKPIANRTARAGEVIEFPVQVERRSGISGPLSFRLIQGDEHGAEVTLNDGIFRWKAPSVAAPREFEFEVRVESRRAEDQFQDKTGFRISVIPSSSSNAPSAAASTLPSILAVAKAGTVPVENSFAGKHEVAPGETLRVIIFGKAGEPTAGPFNWSVQPASLGASVTPASKDEASAAFPYADAALLQWTPTEQSRGQTIDLVVQMADASGQAARTTISVTVGAASGANNPSTPTPGSSNSAPQIIAIGRPGQSLSERFVIKQYSLTPGDTLRLIVAARDAETRRGALQWSVQPSDQGAEMGPAEDGSVSATFAYTDAVEFRWTAPKAMVGEDIDFRLSAADAQGAVGSVAIKIQIKGGSSSNPSGAASAAEYQVALPPEGQRVLTSATVGADASVAPDYSVAPGARRATLMNKERVAVAHVVYQPRTYDLVNLLQTHYETGVKKMLAEFAKDKLNGRVWLYDKQGGRDLFAVYSKDKLDGLRALFSDGQPVIIQEWENGGLKATHWVEKGVVKKSWTLAPAEILKESTAGEIAVLTPLFARLAALEKQINADVAQARRLLRDQY